MKLKPWINLATNHNRLAEEEITLLLAVRRLAPLQNLQQPLKKSTKTVLLPTKLIKLTTNQSL